MAEGGGIALFDCGYGGADEAFEEALNFVVQLAVFVGYRGLRGQREAEIYGVRREWNYLAFHVRSVSQTRGCVSLAIDQLQHAQNLVAGVAHRQRQARARAVAGIATEGIVEA